MLIIPAILERDGEDALNQIEKLRGIVPWIQIDVMDGTMTGNSTFDITELIGELDDFSVEIHIMSTDPQRYFDACDAINADRVYFHLGEVSSPSQVLSDMDKYNFTKGIVLSPQTSIDDAFSYIDDVDAIQVMTVVPGKQGGKFLEDMLDKISFLRERRTELWISVDGGINEKTIKEVAMTGVDGVGVGSAISKSDDVSEIIESLATTIEDIQI